MCLFCLQRSLPPRPWNTTIWHDSGAANGSQEMRAIETEHETVYDLEVVDEYQLEHDDEGITRSEL